MTVGDRIKARRIEMKMSIEELGKRLGKNRSTVYRYETGYIENLPIDVLQPIADVLNTTPAYLMGWQDSPEPKQKQPAEAELSDIKREFIRKVEGMSDSQIARLEQILALVEQTDV